MAAEVATAAATAVELRLYSIDTHGRIQPMGALEPSNRFASGAQGEALEPSNPISSGAHWEASTSRLLGVGFYVAVVGGGEIKDLSRLSPLLDKEEREEAEEEKDEEKEEKEEEEEKEEKEEEEEKDEKEEEKEVKNKEVEEDMRSLWAELRMLPGGSRASLVLYESRRVNKCNGRGRWILTRAYSVNHLKKNCEDQLLSLINRKERRNYPQASRFAQDCWSGIAYKGYLLCSAECYQQLCSVHRFCIEGKLGSGSSGIVQKCSLEDNSTVQFAVKKMACNIYEEMREVQIFSSLTDSTVPKFYEAWVQDEPEGSGFVPQLTKYVVVLMELCGRDLKDLLSDSNQELTDDDKWSIFESIAICVRTLHENGVIHRDLKPNNFFFGLDGILKVGDFGHSCWTSDRELGSSHLGNLMYAAPELRSRVVTTEKVDIYSVGVLYAEIFIPTGDKMDAFYALYDLMSGDYTSERLASLDIEFLKKLTPTEPSIRPSIDEVLEMIRKMASGYVKSTRGCCDAVSPPKVRDESSMDAFSELDEEPLPIDESFSQLLSSGPFH